MLLSKSARFPSCLSLLFVDAVATISVVGTAVVGTGVSVAVGVAVKRGILVGVVVGVLVALDADVAVGDGVAVGVRVAVERGGGEVAVGVLPPPMVIGVEVGSAPTVTVL